MKTLPPHHSKWATATRASWHLQAGLVNWFQATQPALRLKTRSQSNASSEAVSLSAKSSISCFVATALSLTSASPLQPMQLFQELLESSTRLLRTVLNATTSTATATITISLSANPESVNYQQRLNKNSSLTKFSTTCAFFQWRRGRFSSSSDTGLESPPSRSPWSTAATKSLTGSQRRQPGSVRLTKLDWYKNEPSSLDASSSLSYRKMTWSSSTRARSSFGTSRSVLGCRVKAWLLLRSTTSISRASLSLEPLETVSTRLSSWWPRQPTLKSSNSF